MFRPTLVRVRPVPRAAAPPAAGAEAAGAWRATTAAGHAVDAVRLRDLPGGRPGKPACSLACCGARDCSTVLGFQDEESSQSLIPMDEHSGANL